MSPAGVIIARPGKMKNVSDTSSGVITLENTPPPLPEQLNSFPNEALSSENKKKEGEKLES